MTSLATQVGLAFALGFVVPWGFMRLLAPALSHTKKTENYRGRPVFLGLGIVWLVWAGSAIVAGVIGGWVAPGSVLPVFTLAGPLALVAFALGMVDDALGTRADRGFKGHFRALAGGRMTTGMLKLIGIGTASVVVATVLATVAPWGRRGLADEVVHPEVIAGALLATAAIALTSNFVNLTDLRPGRALKVFSALAVLGAALVAISPLTAVPDVATTGAVGRAAAFLAAGIMLLGPVAAVYRYDLGELGMLGDAGANPMGAVAGMVIALAVPLWALALYTVAMLVLNLASERVSFSAVIERTAALRWIDGLGRLPGDVPPTDPGKPSPVRDRSAE